MKTTDTSMGGANGEFPPTQRSAVYGVRSDDEAVRRESFQTIIEGYWKPVYKHLRFKWRATSEEAKDLTQGFFIHLLEKEHLARYDASKAAFRTYVRMCLDGYVSNERKASRRVKRGGHLAMLSLTFEDAEAEWAAQEPAAPESGEALFDREWVRHLFSLAVHAFQESCEASDKLLQAQVFQRLDLAGTHRRPTYQELGAELELPVTQITNYLSWARKEFRRHLLATLRSMVGGEAEFREDARTLFGVDLD